MKSTVPPLTSQLPSTELLHSLLRELFQAEQSAAKHPVIEADRLGHETPPGQAMLAIAAHGKRSLDLLPALAKARGMAESLGGMAVGNLFSIGRDNLADLVLNSAQSYRATMMGLHHCLDLVGLLRRLAVKIGDEALVAWCDDWLTARRPLMDEITAQLQWFVENPVRALQAAKPGVAGTAARAVVLVADKVEHAVSRAARPLS
jgi:hypothetical protein